MTHSSIALLIPMLVGAQLLITLILVRGEICPGQRGRLHRLLPALGLLWLAAATTALASAAVGGMVIYFYLQVQTGKTRQQGPLWLLWLANLSGVAVVIHQVIKLSGLASGGYWLITLVLLGASLGHLVLLLARSRLTAFHRLLPVSGVVSGMAVAIMVAWQVIRLDEAAVSQLTSSILMGLAGLLLGLVIWCLHLIRNGSPARLQLVIALLLLLLSCASLQGLFVTMP